MDDLEVGEMPFFLALLVGAY
jgi:hypothetical protein